MAPLVLVVEDDPDIREVLADVLGRRGFATLTASNGREALDVVHRAGVRPAAIVLDLMMPEMDGEAFLAAKACDLLLATVPTMIVSAQPQRADRSFPATVKAVLPKPVPLGPLLDTLRSICGTGGSAVDALAPRRRSATQQE
jgi:CheY-like chemotaxis protein